MAKVAGEMSLADAPACFTISLRDDRELRAEINNVRTDVIGRIAKFGGGFSAGTARHGTRPGSGTARRAGWRRGPRLQHDDPGNRGVGRLSTGIVSHVPAAIGWHRWFAVGLRVGR